VENESWKAKTAKNDDKKKRYRYRLTTRMPGRVREDRDPSTVHGGLDSTRRVQCGLGYSVAQLVARWLAVRQARIRISAWHPMEVPPTEPTAMKICRDGPQRMFMNELCMNVSTI
jgi:hypothetical protein